MARQEIAFAGELCKAVPGADQLAVVAAVDAVAEQRTQFKRYRTVQFDGEIGDAAARIHLIGGDDGGGGADVDAGGAAATVRSDGLIGCQWQVGIDLTEKKPRAVAR